MKIKWWPRGLLTAISLILLLFFVLYPLGVLFANSVTGGRRLYAAGLSRAAGGLAVPGGLRQHADPGPGRHRLHRAGGRALRLHGGALRLPAEEPGGHPARAHHRDSGDHRRPVLAAAAGQQRPADQPAGRRRHLPAFVLRLDRHGLLDDAGVLHLHLPGRAGRVARLRRTAGGSRPEPGHAAADHQAARAGAGAAAGRAGQRAGGVHAGGGQFRAGHAAGQPRAAAVGHDLQHLRQRNGRQPHAAKRHVGGIHRHRGHRAVLPEARGRAQGLHHDAGPRAGRRAGTLVGLDLLHRRRGSGDHRIRAAHAWGSWSLAALPARALAGDARGCGAGQLPDHQEAQRLQRTGCCR